MTTTDTTLPSPIENLRGLLDALDRITSAEAAVLRQRAETASRFEVTARELIASDIIEEREAAEAERRRLGEDIERLDKEILRLAGKRIAVWEKAEAAAGRNLLAALNDRRILREALTSTSGAR